MSRRRVEHGPRHDLTTLLIALTAIAAIYLAGQLIQIDEPATPTPTPSGVDTNRDKAAQTTSRTTVRTAPPHPSGGRGGANPTNPAAGRERGSSRPAAGSHWHQLAMCESSNNPRAVSPDGIYRGLYQFDAPTWRSVGGTGDPAQASRTEQHRRAVTLQARRGWSPWPQCAQQIGLLP